jgi:hypothetical protein
MSQELEYLTLYSFYNEARAAMAQNILQDHGIPSDILDANMSHLYPWNATSNVRLQVHKDDAADAWTILEEAGLVHAGDPEEIKAAEKELPTRMRVINEAGNVFDNMGRSRPQTALVVLVILIVLITALLLALA